MNIVRASLHLNFQLRNLRGSFVCLRNSREKALLLTRKITLKTHPQPNQFPRCRNSPQSNKYLINQSRIFSLFRYPFFKYSNDLYRLEGTSKHKSFSNYIILAYFRARKLVMFYDILFPDLSRPRSLSLEFLAFATSRGLGRNSSRRGERCADGTSFFIRKMKIH